MGSGASTQAPVQKRGGMVVDLIRFSKENTPAPLVAAKTQWRIKESMREAGSELERELLGILKDPIGQKHIGHFARKILTAENFFCWVEIQEFKDAPSPSYRKSLAKLIYKKYIRTDAPMGIGSLSSDLVNEYEHRLKQADVDLSTMTRDFFDVLLSVLLTDMCQHTYMRFKQSPEYIMYKKEMKDTYNKVTIEDFEYMEVLGSGGFGRVVHARKKSTGKHYAVKIQLKTGLLREHHDQLSQITSEKDILQVCHHPFILDMHYSFQTPAHAIIVTELVRGGDLGDALKTSKEGYISEDRVRLYAAELGLALNHMHELGLIYRDLKPGNVLLGEDGHIILADMGLASGFDPQLLKRKQQNNGNMCLSHARFSRRKTTVGTRGYMAPEIISGKMMKRDLRPGYTFTVDFWSLGITIYELLCGFLPFNVSSTDGAPNPTGIEDIFLQEFYKTTQQKLSPRAQLKIELQKMAQGVTFPAHISEIAQDFIRALLDINPDTRLGCHAEKGFQEFMDHPFFETIDWDKLMLKHVDAKFKPPLPPLSDKKIYISYEQMMTQFDGKDKDSLRHHWYAVPKPEMQKYFENWDYISLHTLRAELGIAKEMDETNIPYKVLQLTGEDAKTKAKKGNNTTV